MNSLPGSSEVSEIFIQKSLAILVPEKSLFVFFSDCFDVFYFFFRFRPRQGCAG